MFWTPYGGTWTSFEINDHRPFILKASANNNAIGEFAFWMTPYIQKYELF